MCVIAYIPAGTVLPSFSTLNKAWATNPHGAGFMYPRVSDDKTLRLQIVKGLMSFTKFRETFLRHRKHFAENVPDKGLVATEDVCLHFRIRSHGPVNEAMTHPHIIAPDLAMCHNGIISGLRHDDKTSDTVIYIEDVLKRLPYGWQRNYAIRQLIASDIGHHNKIVIFDADGCAGILNRQAGFSAPDGIWWSNDYHLDSSRAEAKRNRFQADAFFDQDDGVVCTWPLGVSVYQTPTPSVPTTPTCAPASASTNARASASKTVDVNGKMRIQHAWVDQVTREIVMDVNVDEEETQLSLTLDQAIALCKDLKDGKAVSECAINNNPAFIVVVNEEYRIQHGENMPGYSGRLVKKGG